MKTDFYMIIRIAAVAYILYKVWFLLFRDRLFGLWDRIPMKGKRMQTQEAKSAERKPTGSILGRTNKVLLDDPRKAAPEPVASTDLEPTGFIGQDKQVAADDVEAPELPYTPTEDELYEDAPPPDDNGMSSGVTFEELTDAVNVLKNGTQDEARRMKVAKTLYDLQRTELLDMIVREVCQVDTLENLYKECLDEYGFPLKKRAPLAGFDIRHYV